MSNYPISPSPNNSSHEISQMDYCLSFCLIFLLAFTSELCCLYNFTMKKFEEKSNKCCLLDAGFHCLRMFMSYLVIISIITNDFRFLLMAVSGHFVGNFARKIYQYYNKQLDTHTI